MKTTASIIILIILSAGYINSQSVSDLYKESLPSVITILTKEKTIAEDGTKRMVTAQGQGSGVLISDKGHVLTAAHVVNVAENVMVQFPDGIKVPAEIVSSLPAADIALLKLVWVPQNRSSRWASY